MYWQAGSPGARIKRDVGLFEVSVSPQVLQELQEGEVVMVSFAEEKAAPQEREFI